LIFFIRRASIVVAIIVTLLIIIFNSPASAQVKAGEILQQLERKELTPPPLPEIPVIEKREEVKKQIAPGAKVFIKKINVTVQNKKDTPLLSPKTIKSIISRYENRELDLARMNQITDEITASYRAEGYLIAYAFIPEQEIKEGVLEIGVIEGKTAEITVTGNKSYSSDFIKNHLQVIQKDPSLRENTLERALLILNEYPSLDVKVSLQAGKAFGETDITAQVKDRLPVSGNLTYDNFGSSITSKYRLNAEFNIGNLLTSGDLLMLRGLTGLDRIDFNDLFYGKAEYLFPLNYIGTKAGIYYTNSIYEAGSEYEILNIQGKTDIAGIYITHPIIKTITGGLDIKVGFDYKNISQYMLDDLMSKDKIRVINLGLAGNFTDRFYGRNIFNITYYQGIPGLFGGNSADDSNVSRMNANIDFNKLYVDLMRVQNLPGYNYLLLKASGQLSEDNLLGAEQFSLGGIGSVRGCEVTSKSGDTGYVLSAELYLAPPYPETKIFNEKLGDMFKFVLFADHGGVFKNDVQPGEDKHDYLTSIGAGIRMYAGKYFSARLDYAVPDIDGSYKTENAMIYLQIALSF
jgi:hemolysin activation/secretion protein